MTTLGPYELNSIVTGDARELSKAIPDNSVDIVFTSPPYNTKMKYEACTDDLSENAFWEFQYDWLFEAYRITSSGGRLYATVSDKMLWTFKDLAASAFWRFHQILVWCKPNFVGGARITKDWSVTTEWCMLFHKENRTPMILGSLGVVTHNWIIEASTQSNFNGNLKKVHPAQFPLRVAYAWLSRTPGQIVYDPFVGSGTTAQAAKMLGKDFICFENGTKTADLARQRVASTQPPLPIVYPEQMELSYDHP